MTKEEKEILLQWIQKASHDLILAEILIKANSHPKSEINEIGKQKSIITCKFS